MTRINVVPVESLHRLHLVAELHELPRVFTLARNAQRDILGGRKKIPSKWTLGTGHVTFYLDKLQYCANRYMQLVQEMQRRGYMTNEIEVKDLLDGISPKLLNNYIPTPEALKENQVRINTRLAEAEQRRKLKE